MPTGRHIAEQLGLNYVFFCEFEELHSPLRSPALQVRLLVYASPVSSQAAIEHRAQADVHVSTAQ